MSEVLFKNTRSEPDGHVFHGMVEPLVAAVGYISR
jgi:hypothetical protein